MDCIGYMCNAGVFKCMDIKVKGRTFRHHATLATMIMMTAVTKQRLCSLTFVVTKRLVTNWWQDVHDVWPQIRVRLLHGCYQVTFLVIPRVCTWGYFPSSNNFVRFGLSRGIVGSDNLTVYEMSDCALVIGVMLTSNMSSDDVSRSRMSRRQRHP